MDINHHKTKEKVLILRTEMQIQAALTARKQIKKSIVGMQSTGVYFDENGSINGQYGPHARQTMLTGAPQPTIT